MEYVTNDEYRRQKARLTRAVNNGDPLAVLAAVEKTLDEWEGKAWPDSWHRELRELEDARRAFDRLDHTVRLTTDRMRFDAALERLR